MDNKFCKNCGQANFPNANVCTKCGNAFEQNQGNQFGSSQEPPPTVMAGNQFQVPIQSNQPNNQSNNAPPPKKKSNTKYFVFGGIAVVLLLFIGIIGIAGIAGVMYYTTQQDSEVVRDYPAEDDSGKDNDSKKDSKDSDKTDDDDDNPLSDIEFPSTGGNDDGLDKTKNNGKISNQILISYFKTQKQKVGSFSLNSVLEDEDNRNFPGNIAGVRAKYSKGSTSLTHEFAAYDSMSDLGDDFRDYKRKVKSSGGKVKTDKPTTLIYIKGPLVYLAFYNPQGGFHIISSRLGKDILTYHDDYFGKG